MSVITETVLQQPVIRLMNPAQEKIMGGLSFVFLIAYFFEKKKTEGKPLSHEAIALRDSAESLHFLSKYTNISL